MSAGHAQRLEHWISILESARERRALACTELEGLGEELCAAGRRGPGVLLLAAADVLDKSLGENPDIRNYLEKQAVAIAREARRWLGDNGD